MRTQALQRIDLPASVVCLGSTEFGSGFTKDDSFRLLDAFFKLGGNFIDTAHVYADWQCSIPSIAEKVIGEWVTSNGIRKQTILATKCAYPRSETMHISRLSPAEIQQDLQESLEYLRTDWVDLYWLHRDDPLLPVGEILETLNEQIHKGWIHAIGCSNWGKGRIQQANEYAVTHGLIGFTASQVRWSLAELNPAGLDDPTLVAMDDDMLAYHRTTGLTAVPYSSQAKGFFSGRYGRNKKPSSPSAQKVFQRHYNETNLARLERVEELALQLGFSPSAIALAYLTNQPFPVFPIVGCRTTEQLLDSCQASDIVLSAEHIARLAVRL